LLAVIYDFGCVFDRAPKCRPAAAGQFQNDREITLNGLLLRLGKIGEIFFKKTSNNVKQKCLLIH
jgi:hypothetical protein